MDESAESGLKIQALLGVSEQQPDRLKTEEGEAAESSDESSESDGETSSLSFEQLDRNESFPFYEKLGPSQCPPAPLGHPLDYFSLVFSLQLLNLFVTETNRYAKELFDDKSFARKWVDTSVPEMKAFIAIVLNMGLIRKPNIKSYWSKSKTQRTPWFGEVMTRERFELLLNSVLQYNKYMGGVDTSSEQMQATSSDWRRTKPKYWKKVTFNVIRRMVMNAFNLYKESATAGMKCMSRYVFTEKLIEALTEDFMILKRQAAPPAYIPQPGMFGVVEIPGKKERDCCVCSIRRQPGGRKRSRTMCAMCQKGVHGVCFIRHIC